MNVGDFGVEVSIPCGSCTFFVQGVMYYHTYHIIHARVCECMRTRWLVYLAVCCNELLLPVRERSLHHHEWTDRLCAVSYFYEAMPPPPPLGGGKHASNCVFFCVTLEHRHVILLRLKKNPCPPKIRHVCIKYTTHEGITLVAVLGILKRPQTGNASMHSGKLKHILTFVSCVMPSSSRPQSSWIMMWASIIMRTSFLFELFCTWNIPTTCNLSEQISLQVSAPHVTHHPFDLSRCRTASWNCCCTALSSLSHDFINACCLVHWSST